MGELSTPDSPFKHLTPHFDATKSEGSATFCPITYEDRLTENFIANIVLSDKFSQELLIHTGAVDNRGIPERAAELNRLQQDGFGLLEGQIAT